MVAAGKAGTAERGGGADGDGSGRGRSGGGGVPPGGAASRAIVGGGQGGGASARGASDTAGVKLAVRNLTVSYGGKPALENATFDVREDEIFGIIGPANSGKTSFLRAVNRMDMFTPEMQVEGEILLDGRNVREWRNVYALRRRIGVVLPLPVGLPMSIYDNVSLAPRLGGTRGKAELDEIVERCLRRAALWDEVKDRLHSLGSLLSGGQQQRLTIARALSQAPDLLLLDEFSIAVDPVTTMRIEDVLKELKEEVTIVLVTNLVQQARRLADRTAFFLSGECVEVNETEELFTGTVKDKRTREYVEGRFG
jgi:phosphate transport system ATP-binding protein